MSRSRWRPRLVRYRLLRGKLPAAGAAARGVWAVRAADPRVLDSFPPLRDVLLGAAARGDRCLLLQDGNQAEGLLLYHRGPCYVRGADLALDLGPDDIYLYGVWTIPASRGTGVFRRLWLGLLQRAGPENLGSCTALVRPDNRVMRAALERRGLREQGRVLSLNIGAARLTGIRMGRTWRWSGIRAAGPPAGWPVV